VFLDEEIAEFARLFGYFFDFRDCDVVDGLSLLNILPEFEKPDTDLVLTVSLYHISLRRQRTQVVVYCPFCHLQPFCEFRDRCTVKFPQ